VLGWVRAALEQDEKAAPKTAVAVL